MIVDTRPEPGFGPLAWRPTGPLHEAPRSILIVMLSALGDAIQVLPLLCALRRTFPDSGITWVLESGPRALVSGHPAVDDFVTFQPQGGDRVGRGVVETARAIRATARVLRDRAGRLPARRFDLLLDLQVYLKAGILTALTPAAIKLGFDRRRSRDLNGLFTTHRIPTQTWSHIQDQYFEFLTHIGVSPEPFEYGLSLSEKEREAKATFFSELPGPVCGLVLGTSRPDKDWNAAGYERVIGELRSRWHLTPMFVGGTSPRETAMAAAIQARLQEKVLDARGGGIRRLLWLLAGSRLVISPDTGPLHMARAVGVPVVGLYGATNPRRYGPYRADPRLIVDGYARYPGEPYPLDKRRRPNGMKRVEPETVLEAVEVAVGRGAE